MNFCSHVFDMFTSFVYIFMLICTQYYLKDKHRQLPVACCDYESVIATSAGKSTQYIIIVIIIINLYEMKNLQHISRVTP